MAKNGELKIDKGIPIPGGPGRKHSGEFHAFMDFCKQANIGDSALLDGAPSNYRMAALIASVLIEKTFTFSADGKRVRVWRVK